MHILKEYLAGIWHWKYIFIGLNSEIVTKQQEPYNKNNTKAKCFT